MYATYVGSHVNNVNGELCKYKTCKQLVSNSPATYFCNTNICTEYIHMDALCTKSICTHLSDHSYTITYINAFVNI